MSSEEIAIQLDLAESYIRGGKTRPALEEEAADNPRVFFDLGHVYSLMGDFPMAQTSFERAVRLEPRFGDAWNYLGQVYAAQGVYDAAQKAYSRALEIPNYLRKEFPAYNMADMYARQGDLAQAETYARLAVDKNWRYIPAYLLLGKILIDQDRIQDAQKWLEQGAESDLENTAIMLAVGENLIRLDRLPEARQWFERVIETNPSSDDALMASNYLESIR
jgi:tetratricopeptide (TPR) repeat protein